jgi:hypothetical protein
VRVLHCRGQQNSQAKLTDCQATEIVRRIAAGERTRAVAESFGINPATVRAIYNGVRRPTARAAVIRERKAKVT